jgi:hypothetical protein
MRAPAQKQDVPNAVPQTEPEPDGITSPEHATVPELLWLHTELHFAYRQQGAGAMGKDAPSHCADVVNLHARVVDAMLERQVEHPHPPEDGLDDLSHGFQQTFDASARPRTPGSVRPQRRDVSKAAASEYWDDDEWNHGR